MNRRAILSALALPLSLMLLGQEECDTTEPDDGQNPDDLAYAEQLSYETIHQRKYKNWETVPWGSTEPAESEQHGFWVMIWADPVAEESMKNWTGEMAPNGVIVKEHFVETGEIDALHFTVMEKRPGYDPEHGDWFWAKYEANGDVIRAGKLQDCIACHEPGSQDYIQIEF